MKKLKRRALSVVLSAVLVLSGFWSVPAGVWADEAEQVIPEEAAVIATVRSVADFRQYIDNNYPYTSQEVITTSYEGDTAVQKLEIPADGTLLVCTLSEDAHVKGQVYTNAALTDQLGEAEGCSSDRDSIAELAVEQGTYYYYGSRWNGTNEITVTTYIGFIPSDSRGITYSETGVRYDEDTDLSVPVYKTAQEFSDYVAGGGEATVQGTIETDWKGSTEVHSFSVKESGWLLFGALYVNDNCIDWNIYSDKDCASRIAGANTLEEWQEEPGAVYVRAGTYYTKGERWNGTEDEVISTYLGFVPDQGRFSLLSNELNEDQTRAVVTFDQESGIRVMKGEFDPAVIRDDVFWNTSARQNMLPEDTVELRENGTYLARWESGDGYEVMIPFTVSGLKEAASQDYDIAIVKNEADFREYIDQDGPYTFYDQINTPWSGDTDVYALTVPADGELLVSVLAENGHANGELFADAALTENVKEIGGSVSAREKITRIPVKKGTYYYYAKRWNGYTSTLPVTTFVGLIPDSMEGLAYSDISVQTDTRENVSVLTVDNTEALADYIAQDGKYSSQDIIETEWSGYGAVHSFTVEESGWLQIYALADNNNVDLEIFTDFGLSSIIYKESTVTGTTEAPGKIYLTPGTYYYRGNRWNGYNAFTYSVYLGFLPDAGRQFAVTSNALSGDMRSATVTFAGEEGTVYVQKGVYDAALMDASYWEKEQAVTGNTATTITENGDYVARLETEDGYDLLTTFTVSGIVTPTPAPSATAKPTETPAAAPTVAPSASPEKKTVVYKITVSKKKLTVKKNKTKKLSYSVTKGYKGKVTFTSSKPKVAAVTAKGVVKGKKKGTCKITLKLSNGKKAVVTVKVK